MRKTRIDCLRAKAYTDQTIRGLGRLVAHSEDHCVIEYGRLHGWASGILLVLFERQPGTPRRWSRAGRIRPLQACCSESQAKREAEQWRDQLVAEAAKRPTRVAS